MSVRSLFNGDTQYFVIDKNTRVITPPTDYKNFGVESDENSHRVYFQCPRYVGDNLDLTTLSVRVNYQNANNDKDQYIVTDVSAEGENVYFSWVLSRKATAYKGTIYFVVCAVKTNSNGVVTNEWNTTLTSGNVLSGLEVESPVITEDVTDVVNQLLGIVNTAVSDMESAASESVANVKVAETQAIAAVSNAPNSLFANAIKGNVSGSVVRVDDVSSVEHTVSVKMYSKNLCKFSSSGEKNGLTYSCENGVWTIQGTPTIAYAGIESMSITNMLEDEETYTISQSQYFSSSGATGAIYLQVLIEDYMGNQSFVISAVGARSFVVDKSKYKRYILTLQCGTAMQEVSVSNFTVQLEKGDTATEYTPYVDPTTVTVSLCGKNLFNGIWEVGNITSDAVNGNSTERKRTDFILVNPDTCYFYSTNDGYSNLNVFEYDSNKNFIRGSNTKLGDIKTSENTHYVRLYNELTDYEDFWYQLEEGKIDTEYEPYNGAIYTPDTAGNINAVSVAPTMTLFTDTEGVNVECEYNKDTNKVIQSIIDRLVELESV